MSRVYRALGSALLIAGCASVDPEAPPKLPASVVVTLDRSSIAIGETSRALAVIRDQMGEVLPKQPMFWQTSDPATATVSQDGVVTAVLSGNVTIIANTGALRGTAQLSITRPPSVPVASVEVSLSAPTLFATGSARATAVTRDAAGTVINREVRWTSSDPTIATVANDGVVRAYTGGSVTIRAESEGVYRDVVLSVPRVDRVEATYLPQPARIGRSYPLTAVALFADGSAAPRPISWNLVNPADGILTTTNQVKFEARVAGPIGLQISSQGVTRLVTIDAYGWTVTSVAGRTEAVIRNHPYFAATEGIYTGQLIVGCDNGQAYLRVATNGLTVTGIVSGPERDQFGETVSNNWNAAGNIASRPSNLPIDLRETIRSINGDVWLTVETTVGRRVYLFHAEGLRQAMAPAAQSCTEFAP